MISNITSALNSIWGNKVRSFLTLLGVVIGVTAVTTLVALGEGLKSDVSELIQGFGTNVLIIIGGKFDGGDDGLSTMPTNPGNLISGDILTTEDVQTIQDLPAVEQVAPISFIPGSIKYKEMEITPIIIGTYPNFVLSTPVLSIEHGRIFAANDEEGVVVIGELTSDILFGENTNPVGATILFNNIEYEVIGKMGKAKLSDLMGSDFDNMVLFPFDEATKFNKGQEKILRIMVKAADDADVEVVSSQITERLIENHDGEEDFSVLSQEELLGLFNDFVDLATTMVSAIAAISLIVGGIGIMNIMLVTVTERTKEIGLRKAVGATKFAILTQFLMESVVITFIGGLIGLGISIGISFYVARNTPLTPVVSGQVILMATLISMTIGVIFGLWPAMRAANKDPIEALRHE